MSWMPGVLNAVDRCHHATLASSRALLLQLRSQPSAFLKKRPLLRNRLLRYRPLTSRYQSHR